MKMNLEKLVDIVSEETGTYLRSRCRDNDHVLARAIFYDLAYNKLRLGSLAAIGKSVGRNHATVLHSLNNVLPHIKNHYREMHSHRMNLLDRFVLDEDTFNEDTVDRITSKYNELKERYDNIVAELDSNESTEASELISSIRRVPPEKLSVLKLRLDAIMRML
jgi:hypothetical protein